MGGGRSEEHEKNEKREENLTAPIISEPPARELPPQAQSTIVMSYQNPTQECYGADNAPSQNQQLLNPNVGVPNSSRGEGTTLSEITSKMRFLNCSASLFVILFHTFPRVINPIRFAILLASPIQLVLEIVLASCALSLFVVEARVPVIGQRVLEIVRRTTIDLDAAKGRVTILLSMAAACGMIQYFVYVSKHGQSGVDDAATSSIDTSPIINSTFIENATTSNTSLENRVDSASNVSSPSITHHQTNLDIIFHCTIVSPTMWILISLIIFTLYIEQTYPEYACARGYPDTPGASSANVNATNTNRGGGYQNSGVPSWAQPTV